MKIKDRLKNVVKRFKAEQKISTVAVENAQKVIAAAKEAAKKSLGAS